MAHPSFRQRHLSATRYRLINGIVWRHEGSLIFENCVLDHNQGTSGGAIYADGQGTDLSHVGTTVVIKDTLFWYSMVIYPGILTPGITLMPGVMVTRGCGAGATRKIIIYLRGHMSSGATQGDLAESAKSKPLEPWCVGTAQLTSETCAASKSVPEGKSGTNS